MIAYAAIAISILIIILGRFELKSSIDQAKYEKHRFKAFRLRERLIMLKLEGEISGEKCEQLYIALNWVIYYLREIPTSLIDGFLKSAEEVGISDESHQFQMELDSASEELLIWYKNYTELLSEAVELFTPVNMRGRRLMEIPVLRSLYVIYLACWLVTTLEAYRGHPLLRNVRIVFSKKSVRQAQTDKNQEKTEPSPEVKKVREKGQHLREVRQVHEKGQYLQDIATAAASTISSSVQSRALGLTS